MESLEEAPTANAPISAHPAFPAIVALWFAALLGLGSLVLPVAVIERLVMLTHISSIIPAAEPLSPTLTPAPPAQKLPPPIVVNKAGSAFMVATAVVKHPVESV